MKVKMESKHSGTCEFEWSGTPGDLAPYRRLANTPNTRLSCTRQLTRLHIMSAKALNNLGVVA